MEVAGTSENRGERATQDSMTVMGSKPLHRFIRGEPRCLGIAILVFGCAEFQMGVELMYDQSFNSITMYTPFWQGALFVISGILSIYTEVHPSKKMVTVCLAMYVVSILGVVVSFINRLYCLSTMDYHMTDRGSWHSYHMNQVKTLEATLLTASLCVSGVLIFMSTMARLALKSTNTQIVLSMPSQY